MTYSINDDDFAPRSAAADASRKTRMSVEYYTAHPNEIGRRLDDLDAESSVEKVLQVATAGSALSGFLFALTRSRVWLLLPVASAGLSLQQALSGHSRGYDLVRKLGYRTAKQIEQERFALRSIRGDAVDLDSMMGEPDGATRVEMPENVGRTSDAMPQRSEHYVE